MKARKGVLGAAGGEAGLAAEAPAARRGGGPGGGSSKRYSGRLSLVALAKKCGDSVLQKSAYVAIRFMLDRSVQFREVRHVANVCKCESRAGAVPAGVTSKRVSDVDC